MEEKVHELLRQLESNIEKERKEAIWLLGKHKDPVAIEPLTNYLLKDENASVREIAAKALGDLGSKDATRFLCQALQDKSPGVRKQSVISLSRLNDNRAVEHLENALKDPVIRVEAAQALGLLGKPTGIIEAIKDKNSEIAARAAEAAGVIKSPEIGPALIEVLSGEEWKVRRNAAETLGKLRYGKSVEPLIKILTADESFEARSTAAEALGKIRDEKALDALINALNDPHWEVRKNVAEALGKLENSKAVSSLIKTLGDADWNTRCNALNALAQIKDSKAAPDIINSLRDESKNVRCQAAKALAELWQNKAREPLTKHMAEEEDNWVKNYLSKVIEELPGDMEGRKYKALLVDDDKFISKLLRQTFELENFEVLTANNGKVALEKAIEFMPDIIILDIMMPEMDGWEVCEQLKLNPGTGAIPIVILTAKSQEKDIEKGKSLGVAHYFSKPFDTTELVKTVNQILSTIKGSSGQS